MNVLIVLYSMLMAAFLPATDKEEIYVFSVKARHHNKEVFQTLMDNDSIFVSGNYALERVLRMVQYNDKITEHTQGYNLFHISGRKFIYYNISDNVSQPGQNWKPVSERQTGASTFYPVYNGEPLVTKDTLVDKHKCVKITFQHKLGRVEVLLGDKLKSGFLFNNLEEKFQRRALSLTLYSADGEETHMQYLQLKNDRHFVLSDLLHKLIAKQVEHNSL